MGLCDINVKVTQEELCNKNMLHKKDSVPWVRQKPGRMALFRVAIPTKIKNLLLVLKAGTKAKKHMHLQ